MTIQPSGYGNWTKSYEAGGGWYTGTGWCYTTIPGDPPMNLATAGTVSCSGTITATFTWSGEDDPPSSVVVKEECVASYAGSSGSRDTTGIVSGDSPSSPLALSGLTFSRANDSFYNYLMYRPPGASSQAVQIKLTSWFWAGQATLVGSVWTASACDEGWQYVEDYPTHPEWTENVSQLEWESGP